MKLFFYIFIMLTFSQCRMDDASIEGTPKIVCTTSISGDAAMQIAGDKGEVTVLMGPGVDPHEYIEKPSDTDLLESADIIVYHGLDLEGKMSSTLQKVKDNGQKIVIDLSKALKEDDLLELGDSDHGHDHDHDHHDHHGAHDPHVWNDVQTWTKCVAYLSAQLIEAKSEFKADYEANTKAYLTVLKTLDADLKEQFNSIPVAQRVLVTAHDAFGYLARAYNLKVESLQGYSTAAEFGIKDITNLANFIQNNQIKSIFLESSVPDKNLEAVITHCKENGHTVSIGGKLYSDALGDKASGADTYSAMMRANANTIVNGLK